VTDSFHTINIKNVDTFFWSYNKLDTVYFGCIIQLSTSPCLTGGCTRYHKFSLTLTCDCISIVLFNFLKP
jgi:hypothetical protein